MKSEEADRFSRFEVIDRRWSLTNDRFSAGVFPSPGTGLPSCGEATSSQRTVVIDAGSLKEAGRSAVAVGVDATQSFKRLSGSCQSYEHVLTLAGNRGKM